MRASSGDSEHCPNLRLHEAYRLIHRHTEDQTAGASTASDGVHGKAMDLTRQKEWQAVQKLHKTEGGGRSSRLEIMHDFRHRRLRK